MLDNLVGGLVSLGLAFLAVAWLAYRQSLLQRRVEAIEAALPKLQAADARSLEESVAEMIDELKAAADDACAQVAQKIDNLQRVPSTTEVQHEVENRPSALRGRIEAHRGLPLDQIAQLAERGLTITEIARQTGAGPAEVELALRYRHRKSPSLTALTHIDQVRRDTDKEVAVA